MCNIFSCDLKTLRCNMSYGPIVLIYANSVKSLSHYSHNRIIKLHFSSVVA